MNMADYSKDVETTMMDRNMLKKPTHAIGLRREQVQKGKVVKYSREVANFRPEKKEPSRVIITAGGNILKYTGETSTETASIETTKLLINSTQSTKDAKFMAIDIEFLHSK